MNTTMSTATRILGLPGVLMLALACTGNPSDVKVEPIDGLPRALSAAETRMIEGSNEFAFGFLREALTLEESPNTFLSPLSVSMALGMTMNGAAGESRTQLRDGLGFEGMEERAINEAYRDLIALLLALDPAVELAIGNSLWFDQNRVALLPEFVERAETYFDAEAATLDFSDPAARDRMNGWVADVTSGRIEDLIDRVPADAVAYLINAVYFLGDWRATFDEERTRDGVFTRADGSQVTVPFMSDEVGYRVLHDGNGARGVELPYGGGAFTAVAVLPPSGQGIDEFVAALDPSVWDAWMAEFDARAEVEDLDRDGMQIDLPKFELRWKSELSAALTALGIEDIFVGGVADLSRMNGARDLYVSRVLHETFVRVDEEGTEAAGATAVEIRETSAPPSLRFDRPFLFAIRERYSGAILFMGVVGDPSDEGSEAGA